MREIYRPAEDLLAPSEGLCSMEVIKKFTIGWTCSSHGVKN